MGLRALLHWGEQAQGWSCGENIPVIPEDEELHSNMAFKSKNMLVITTLSTINNDHTK